MSTSTSFRLRAAFAFSVALAGLLNSAHAALNYWDPGGATVLSTSSETWEHAKWAPTSTPTGSTTTFTEGVAAAFSASAGNATNGTYNVTANANHSIAGIFNGDITDMLSTNLQIKGTGILTITAAAGGQGFDTRGGGNTTIYNVLAGTGGIQTEGTGSLYLFGTNTYSGGTYLNTGAGLNFNNSSAFGTGIISNMNTAPVLATPLTDGGGNSTGATNALTIANVVEIYNIPTGANNTTYTIVGNGSAPITWTGAWHLNGPNTNTLTLDTRSGVLEISGVISGAMNLTKTTTSGTLILSGANTYTGKTSINGPVSVSSLNKVTSGSASSNLGHPTSTANGTIAINGGTLIYTGAGETTDRVIDLSGTTGGATIQADGTGNLIFTANNTATGAGDKTLTLTGSGAATNSIGKIVDNSVNVNQTSVSKTGTTTWTLAAANTYTGTTSVTAGKLQLGVAGSLGTNTLTWGGATIDNTSGSDLSFVNNATISGTATYLGSANALTLTGTATLTGNRTISVTANTLTLGAIAQDASTRNFTKSGSGTLAVTGGCTYSGTTTISSGGTFKLAGSSVLGANNSGIYTNTMSIAGTLDYSSSGSQTIISNFSGAGSILVNGPGTLTLAGGLPTFTGTISVNSSSLIAGTSSCLPNNCTLSLNGGTVNLGANNPTVKILKYAGVEKPAGTYGGTSAGAQHTNANFSGSGILTVTAGSTSTTSVTSDVNSSLVGQNVNFTIVVTGVNGDGTTPNGTVTIYDNGVPIATNALIGSGASATNIYSTSTLSQGAHPITASWAGNDSYGASTSPIYTQNVVQPPVVTSPTTPVTITTNAGTTALLTVTLADTAGVTYQWKKGGVNLANGSYSNAATVVGSTAATLSLVNVKAADASPGDYTCAVTNAAGNASTAPITLIVIDPSILVQPTNSTFECSSNGCLSVTAGGTTNTNGVLTYQWYTPSTSGTAIPNETNSTLCFNTVHFSDAGSYCVVVSNAFGNSITSQVAVVTVQDTTKPVLIGVPSDAVADCSSIPAPAPVTAMDTCDASPIVNLVSVTNAGGCTGNYSIVRTWIATDSSGNTNTASQTITVTDTNPPVITLTGAASITWECHTTYIDPGYSANDACAGPVGVILSGLPDTNTLGIYTITYTATDPCGNASSTNRIVNVIDSTPPVISLIPGASTICKRDSYTDPGATATDTCSATVTITTNNPIATNTPGFYTITYTATDASLNSTTTNRVVQVVDCGDPVANISVASVGSIVNVPDGSDVQFNVTATGSDPKTYTWYVKDSADVGPGVPIFTNHTSSATFPAVAVNRQKTGTVSIKVNSYYVVVDNSFNQPQTSATTNVSIVLDIVDPTLMVKNPKKKAVVGQAYFASTGVTGTAADSKGHVAHVKYEYVSQNPATLNLVSGPYDATITNGTGAIPAASVTWGGNQPPLYPGTNQLIVWTTDLAGNANLVTNNTTVFFYAVPMDVTLNKIGDGSGTVAWKGKLHSGIKQLRTNSVDTPTIPLYIGETYTLTYTPDTKAADSHIAPGTNTVASVITNTAGMGPLTNSVKKFVGQPFLMQSNITSLPLEFDRDRFVDMKGQYNGLFSVAGSPSLDSCGSVQLTLASTGKMTGNVIVRGLKHNLLPAVCKADGTFTATNKDDMGMLVIGTINWSDSLNPTAAQQISGQVTKTPGWVATMLADETRKDALPTTANATFAIADCSGIAEAGSAIGTIALNSTSQKAAITLTIPDVTVGTGKKLAFKFGGSRSGNIPVYTYYKDKNGADGAIIGFLNGHDANISTNGPFAWIKAANGSALYYPAGFANGSANMEMSPYTTGGLSTGTNNMVIGGGGQSPDVNFVVDQGLAKQGTLPTNFYSATISAAGDGTVKVIYGTGVKSLPKAPANGVILQNVNQVRGFLLNKSVGAGGTATASGKLTVDPAGP